MWVLPLLLLLLVAILHRWRIHRYGQSAWKGGSFAMFSELWRNTDLTYLTVRNSESSEGSLQVTSPEILPLREKAQTIPTAKNWNAWIRWVAGEQWLRCGNSAHPRMAKLEGASVAVSRVTVRFRRFDFDGKSGEYRVEEVASYSVDSHGKPLRGIL